MNEAEITAGRAVPPGETKFCMHCGGKIAKAAVFCPLCGCQVGEIHTTAPAPAPQVIINNSNQNVNRNVVAGYGRLRNKWVAFFLCFFLGFFGAHKFYEGKAGMGLLYLLTVGLFGFGWIVDCIALLFKPNPYFV